MLCSHPIKSATLLDRDASLHSNQWGNVGICRVSKKITLGRNGRTPALLVSLSSGSATVDRRHSSSSALVWSWNQTKPLTRPWKNSKASHDLSYTSFLVGSSRLQSEERYIASTLKQRMYRLYTSQHSTSWFIEYKTQHNEPNKHPSKLQEEMNTT